VHNAPLHSHPPLKGRTASLRPALLLVLLLPLAPGTATASAGDPTTPGWVRLETRLSVTPEILDTRWSSVVRAPSSLPDYSLSSAAPSAAAQSLSRSK